MQVRELQCGTSLHTLYGSSCRDCPSFFSLFLAAFTKACIQGCKGLSQTGLTGGLWCAANSVLPILAFQVMVIIKQISVTVATEDNLTRRAQKIIVPVLLRVWGTGQQTSWRLGMLGWQGPSSSPWRSTQLTTSLPSPPTLGFRLGISPLCRLLRVSRSPITTC